MFRVILFFTIFMLSVSRINAHMSHQKDASSIWENENVPLFDELMLTWNGERPSDGDYRFYISVKTDEWSPQLLYATWGLDGQSSFEAIEPASKVKVFQDALMVTQGKATGFKIEVFPKTSDLSLHVYTNGDRKDEVITASKDLASVSLNVKGLSQIALNHPRAGHLCSPTSTCAVVQFLSNQHEDPLDFASHVWDKGFDIYGNWVFNAAQASNLLGPSWHVWVERLSGFDAIHASLQKGIPVVVSIRGPLKGSAAPYLQGHLIAVIGYEAETQSVLCMDPAFPKDEETKVSYPLEDFLQAWSRRGRVAYYFSADK